MIRFSYLIPVLATSFIALLLGIQLLRRSKGNSLLSWYGIAFVLLYGPASLFWHDVADLRITSLALVFDDEIVESILQSVFLVTIILIVYFLVELVANDHTKAAQVKLIATFRNSTPIGYWVGILLACVGLFVLIRSPQGQVVLQDGLAGLGDYGTYYGVRFNIGMSSSSLLEQYVIVVSLLTALPLCVLYSLQRALLEWTRKWMLRWLALSLLWMLVAVLMYQKAPLMTALSSQLLCLLMSPRSERISARVLARICVAGGTLSAAAVVCLYAITHGTHELIDVISELTNRFVTVQLFTTYAHFEVFPALYPHTYYGNSGLLNLMLGGGQVSTAAGWQPYQIASWVLTGVPFNMNTGLLGSSWAEFGLLGVIQGALIFFGALMLWDVYFSHRKSELPIGALIAFFVARVWALHNNDLMYLLVHNGTLLAPVFYLLLFTGRSSRSEALAPGLRSPCLRYSRRSLQDCRLLDYRSEIVDA